MTRLIIALVASALADAAALLAFITVLLIIVS